VRALDNFCVFSVQDSAAGALWSLDSISLFFTRPPPEADSWPTILYAHGTLVPLATHVAASAAESCQVGPILDWSVVADDGHAAHVAIQTERAWYQLLTPLDAYTEIFAQPLLFARLCCHTRAVLRAAPESAPPPLHEVLLQLCKELMVQHGYRVNLVTHMHVRRFPL
jgi:hypothetical protein